MSPLRVFVAGTDTEVGKTRAATTLCRAFVLEGRRVAAMKPIASGSAQTQHGLRNDDAVQLLDASNVRASYEEINPYAFAPAIAPHIAAAEAGVTIDFEVLDRYFERLALRSDVTVVEGAGGWLAPIDARHSFADLAMRWQLDVILVVGMRLGCLNHAFLTAEAIRRRGLRLSGWIGNAIDPTFERFEENRATLGARLDAPCVAMFPFAPQSTTTDFVKILRPALSELDSGSPP